ncbi:unnamed protein product [Closterium sp. NIES-54]
MASSWTTFLLRRPHLLCAFVRDASADKLSSRAVPCAFLGFPPDAPRWQFYHPTSRRVLSSQDITFDKSVSYYRLFPYRTAPLPPLPLFLTPGAPPVDPIPAQGPAHSGVSQVDPVELVEVAVDSAVERGGAEPERAESGGPPGVLSQREPLSPQQLREWYARSCRHAAGATGLAARGASGAGAAGGAASAAAAGGASGAAGGVVGAGAAGTAGARGTSTIGGPAGVEAAGGAGAAGPRGARTGGTEAAGAGGAAGVGAVGAGAVTTGGAAGAGAVGGTGAGGAVGGVAGDPGAEGTGAVSAVSGGAAQPRPPPPVQSQSQLQPASPLPGPSPYSGPTRGLTERRDPESHPASPESPVRTGRRVPRHRPPPVPGNHSMTLRPSTAPQCVPLPPPPASSLPALADPESDSLRTASPTVTHLLATVVTDSSFESTAASALVAELVDFAAHCPLDYAASLVAESESVSDCPPSNEGECALGTDVLDDRQEEFECFATAVPHLVSVLLALEGDPDAPDIPTPRSYAEAIEGPYSSPWQAAMDAEMASWKSTGTYVDEVPPPAANIVSGMWIFRVKQPPGSPPVFKARYVARGFRQRQGVDFFQTFSPTPKMTTLWSGLFPEAAPVAALPCTRPCCCPTLHPPLVSTRAALRRRAACCRAAPPGTEPRRPAEPHRPAEPRRTTETCRPAEPHCPSACTASAATAATGATATMASPTILTFDVEGRAVDFDVWIDDLQLFLQCDSRDGVSLFDHTSGVSTAPAASANSTVRSQWTTRDAVDRLAVRSHLPSAERAHFGQYKTAKSLYDAVVVHYSSPATAALSRLMLPYLFPDLAAFATVADLITHLRTSDARYRAALPTDILAVGDSRGNRRALFFEGCSLVPLLPSVASVAAVDLVGTEEVRVASAPSGTGRTSRGKGGGGNGGGGGGGGGGGRGVAVKKENQERMNYE